jgi:hypothetical protein
MKASRRDLTWRAVLPESSLFQRRCIARFVPEFVLRANTHSFEARPKRSTGMTTSAPHRADAAEIGCDDLGPQDSSRKTPELQPANLTPPDADHGTEAEQAKRITDEQEGERSD